MSSDSPTDEGAEDWINLPPTLDMDLSLSEVLASKLGKAIHEAGHASIAILRRPQIKTEVMTIRDGVGAGIGVSDDTGGCLVYFPVEGADAHRTSEDYIAILFGGIVAQEIFLIQQMRGGCYSREQIAHAMRCVIAACRGDLKRAEETGVPFDCEAICAGVRSLLQDNWDRVWRLANHLVAQETLFQGESEFVFSLNEKSESATAYLARYRLERLEIAVPEFANATGVCPWYEGYLIGGLALASLTKTSHATRRTADRQKG